eukprot:TRINITY_DN4690_c0_g2_i4.p1 TRINITY_DN4690_c0_g2~~TRINITY_DN4690_c0_g2_i4.p1  ORF type:complete len:325 (+),score=32.49 TRINITY_DN4690_c0_g2_i4:182-1156(+)
MQNGCIPTVDLSLPAEDCAAQIKQACVEYGIFYLINHPILTDLINRQFEQSRAFFSLPLEEKRNILYTEYVRGYSPLKDQIVDHENQKVGDLKEAIYIGNKGSEDPKKYKCPFFGPNLWPDEKLLPEFRGVMETYTEVMVELGINLHALIARSLELEPDFFEPMFDNAFYVLKPLYYPKDPSRPEEGIFSHGAHSDFGTVTIIAIDGVPGLQLLQGENWVDIPHKENALIVNLGMMITRWTNGLYKAPIHRVVKTACRERYSTPFFCNPNYYATIECVPTCAGQDGGSKFPPITAGQFLRELHDNASEISKKYAMETENQGNNA